MNINQATFTQQAKSAGAGKVKTERVETTLAPPFEGHLTSASNEVEAFAKEEAKVKEEKEHKDQLRERTEKELRSRQMTNEALAMAMLNAGKLEQNQNQTRLTTDLLGQQSQNKEFSNQVAGQRFNKDIEHAKGQAAQEVIEERVAQRKAHLLNPAVTKSDNPQTKEIFFDGMTDKAAEKLKGNQQQGKSFHQENPESNQGQKNQASLSQLLRPSANNKPEVQPHQAQPQTASAAQSQLQQANYARMAGADSLLAAKATGKSSAEVQPIGNSGNTQAGLNAKGASNIKSAAATARPRENVDIKEVVGQVKFMIDNKKNEMIMKLRPEHLGKMEIKIRKDGDSLVGQMKVESLAVKQLLESQLPSLQQGLEDQGIKLGQIQIFVDGQAPGQEQTQGFAQGQSGQDSQPQSNLGTKHASNLSKEETFDPEFTTRRPVAGDSSAVNLFA